LIAIRKSVALAEKDKPGKLIETADSSGDQWGMDNAAIFAGFE